MSRPFVVLMPPDPKKTTNLKLLPSVDFFKIILNIYWHLTEMVLLN